ncbi:MAG TPA: ABC transporter ATP-binding protein [Chloroflexota bacterium]|nr:ABC transporter ATP-binding protein [Chloroflexota bacterium]
MASLEGVPKEGLLAEKKHRLNARDGLRLLRALKLVWSVAPRYTVASVGLTVLQGLLPLAGVWLMKLIIDGVTSGVTGPDRGHTFGRVAILIALAAGVGLAGVVLRSLAAMVDQALGQTVTDHVTDLIHAQSVAVDLEYYENPRYHDALHRAQQEAPFRPTSIVRNLTNTGQAVVSLVAMAGLLLTLHWAVGLIVLGAAIPGAVVRFRYAGKLFAWQRRRTEAERESYYAHWLLTGDAHAKEIRLFGLGDRFRRWHRDLRGDLRRELIGLTGRRSLAELGAGAGAVVAVFGTFAFIAWRAIQGAITLGMMVAYYQAFQISLTSLQAVLGGVALLYEDSLFLTGYDEFMSLEPRIQAPARPAPVPQHMAQGIRFESVDFRYPDTERTALKDVSLSILPGEVTALIGPNGSGKSTLVKLLCRLYDPVDGVITLDGIDLRRFDTVDLRRHMSVVFQDFARYQVTAGENIRLGNVWLPERDPAIESAARSAGIHEALAGLQRGYDTLLGKWFDGGEELSVGEWQKVALARAFVRDAQILVFDEPTSGLDPRAEREVFQHIKLLAQDRAVILVSHRFSTVRAADHIHVFDRGSVVESGAHEELMALDGRYASMYRIQTGTSPA